MQVNADVTGSGNATLELQGNLISLGANLTTANQNITLSGPTSLTADVMIDTGAGAGDIVVNGTVNGAQALSLDAGTGNVSLNGVVGGTSALTDLDLTGTFLRINTGTINADAGAGGATLDFTGAVVLGSNLTIDLDGTNNNNLQITGTLDSDAIGTLRSFTVRAGTSGDATLGDVGITGEVGGTTPLASGSVIGAGTMDVGSNVFIQGNISAAADEMLFGGTLVQSVGGGDITLAPTSVDRGILVTGTATADPTRLVLDTLGAVFTTGRMVVGSTTSGIITVENTDLSANQYGGFSFLSKNANVVFANSGADQLILPSAADVRFSLGTGNVLGDATVENLVASSGTVRFSAGAVTMGARVANLETSTLQGGFVFANSQGLTIRGTQRAGAAFPALVNTADYGLAAYGNITLASGSSFTARNITLLTESSFINQSGLSPFTNQNGGRTLVFSTQPIDNQPPTAVGGLSGFGTVYLESPDITVGAFLSPGTYTVNNSLPSGNLMVFSGPPAFPQIEPGSATYNELVNTVAYKAAVPVTGYSMPSIYTGQVGISFRSSSGSAPKNSLGKQESVPPASRAGRLSVGDVKSSSSSGPMANLRPSESAGRLKVSQVKPPESGNGRDLVGYLPTGPAVRVGRITLRMSGQYYPFELAEVTMGTMKVSLNR